MGFELNRLTAIKVAKLKKRGRYGDGGGLWLQVSEAGTKAWLFRYKRGGRARQMGLGPIHTISLAEARAKAQEARKLLLEGKDPIDEKRAVAASFRARTAGVVTFRECAERYIAAHADSWKHAAHRRQWPQTLADYVYPKFGDLSVAVIDVGLVLKALEPIWKIKPETAARVRMRIETVLNWATARGYRTGDNPARWNGNLKELLPPRKRVQTVKHHPALPYVEIGAFMTALRERTGSAARALEFAILTACRTGEAIGARWEEIDLKNALWTIPGERMKAGRPHRVPLSKRAMKILGSLPRDGEYVFIGARSGAPLSNMAMLNQLDRMGRKDITVHGFRSTFNDWAAERTAYPREVVEMALAHVVGDKTEAAYRRGDLFDKRRRLAEDWSGYCDKTEAAGQVVSLKRREAKS